MKPSQKTTKKEKYTGKIKKKTKLFLKQMSKLQKPLQWTNTIILDHLCPRILCQQTVIKNRSALRDSGKWNLPQIENMRCILTALSREKRETNGSNCQHKIQSQKSKICSNNNSSLHLIAAWKKSRLKTIRFLHPFTTPAGLKPPL